MTESNHKVSVITYPDPDISMNLKSLRTSSGNISVISPGALGLLSSSNITTTNQRSKSNGKITINDENCSPERKSSSKSPTVREEQPF
jgi:hypothetical protein